MSRPIPDDLMARVLVGEASAEERALVEAWAAESTANARELERLRAAFADGATPAEWDLNRAWLRVAGQLESTQPSPEVIPIPPAPHWSTTVFRLAAAVLVVVGLAFAWQQLRSPGPPISHATAAGERLEVALPDGSVAVLAPNSTLTLPADFGADRTLSLEGEAWFDVVHDAAVPFVVHAAGFEVRDIGTVFTVDARRAATVVVTVVEGEVLVHHRSGEMADASLTPGQVGRFTGAAFGREGRAVVAENQPVAELTAWRTGTLVLADAPVAEALARLTAWYGVAFTLSDSAAGGQIITATLPLDAIDEAAEVIALLLGATAERDSSGITFR